MQNFRRVCAKWARAISDKDLIILPHPKLGELESRAALDVLQSTRAPVLFADSELSGGEIVAAADLSHPRFPVLEAAWKIACETGRRLTTLHCAPIVPYPELIRIPIHDFDVSPVYFPSIRARPLEALQNAQELVGIERASARVLPLPAARSIETVVERLQTELLVMGSHRRSWLHRRLFGSTCEAVLGRVSCSVLVVPLAS